MSDIYMFMGLCILDGHNLCMNKYSLNKSLTRMKLYLNYCSYYVSPHFQSR